MSAIAIALLVLVVWVVGSLPLALVVGRLLREGSEDQS